VLRDVELLKGGDAPDAPRRAIGTVAVRLGDVARVEARADAWGAARAAAGGAPAS
jgi:hypothetical protein